MTQEQVVTPYLKEYLEYIGGSPDTRVIKEVVCDAYRDEGQYFATGPSPADDFSFTLSSAPSCPR